jgi:DNA-binding transcriptional MerR regulator
MEPGHDKLLPIGAFASVSYLSIKALRLYDQLGLLMPAYVDTATGYRYYRFEQLPRARLIRMMRAIAMPLATIRQVLAVEPAAAEQLVQRYLREVEERAALAQRLVPGLITSLQGELSMNTIAVEVREARTQPVLSITSHVLVDRLVPQIKESLAQLRAEAERLGAMIDGPPFGLYHGPINHDEDGPIEVCLPIQQLASAQTPVEAKELPATKLAVAALSAEQCVFPAVLQGYDVTYDWIAQNGYTHNGPPREVWLEAPAESNPDDRMEIAWPFCEV